MDDGAFPKVGSRWQRSEFRTAHGSNWPVDSARRQAVVWDLDGTLWAPEMYQLWGRGGAPFTVLDSGNVRSVGREEVAVLEDGRRLLEELSRRGIVLGIASTTDEPEWAMQCLRLMRGHSDAPLFDYFHHDTAVEVCMRACVCVCACC